MQRVQVCGRKKNCCCCWLLFTQPDFENQKSHLEEYITSQGHICDFYPKYHCKLNFIEQYWGAMKLIYRSTAKTRDMKKMEENVKISLDDMYIVQIQQWASFSSDSDMPLIILSPISYANHAGWFISTYGQGLSGPEAAWANQKYHGHWTLPPEMATKLKKKSTIKSMVHSKILYRIFQLFLTQICDKNYFIFPNLTFCCSWCLYNWIT